MEVYQEVLQDKLKNYHQNLGTIKCKFALEEVSQGLLRNEDRNLVTGLFQTLPLIEELDKSEQFKERTNTVDKISPSNNNASNSSIAVSDKEKSGDEDQLFIKQVSPHTQISHTHADQPHSPHNFTDQPEETKACLQRCKRIQESVQ